MKLFIYLSLVLFQLSSFAAPKVEYDIESDGDIKMDKVYFKKEGHKFTLNLENGKWSTRSKKFEGDQILINDALDKGDNVRKVDFKTTHYSKRSESTTLSESIEKSKQFPVGKFDLPKKSNDDDEDDEDDDSDKKEKKINVIQYFKPESIKINGATKTLQKYVIKNGIRKENSNGSIHFEGDTSVGYYDFDTKTIWSKVSGKKNKFEQVGHFKCHKNHCEILSIGNNKDDKLPIQHISVRFKLDDKKKHKRIKMTRNVSLYNNLTTKDEDGDLLSAKNVRKFKSDENDDDEGEDDDDDDDNDDDDDDDDNDDDDDDSNRSSDDDDDEDENYKSLHNKVFGA